MAREIAVFTGADGCTAPLTDEGKVTVYRKHMRVWQPVRETGFWLNQHRGLREMRLKLSGLIDFLGSCRIFAARSVIGVAYFELEKAQVNIWEFEGKPHEFLDYIDGEEEKQPAAEAPKLVAVPVAEERAPGRLFINIKEIQETEAGITSKQVLMPVIRGQRFEELEILCNHVPPWLEIELSNGGFTVSTEKIDSRSYTVHIQKAVS